jgi:hypothetical protein
MDVCFEEGALDRSWPIRGAVIVRWETRMQEGAETLQGGEPRTYNHECGEI